uniref:Uncharacterized protein n=1 Tax=Panagrolaimus davidi TaxID=227884 RepID=A0A914PRN8_9BILA
MDLSDGRKYIGCSVYEAGGLGNQLWRFASMYGIGKNTNRIPYFESDRFKPVEGTDLTFMNLTEISAIFPAASEMFKIMNTKSQKAVITDFANDNCKYDKNKVDCCKYENPKKFVGTKTFSLKSNN